MVSTDLVMKDLDEARAVNTKSKQNKDRTEALSARVASLEISLDETRTKLTSSEGETKKLELQLKQTQEAEAATASAKGRLLLHDKIFIF